MGPIRVLVLDPSPVVRRGVQYVLEAMGHFEVVASDASPEEGRAAAAQLRPQVVLVDLERAGGPQAEVIAELKAELPATKVVAFTESTDQAVLVRAITQGADAVLNKDASAASIALTVRLLGEGDNFVISHHLWPLVTSALARSASTRSALDRLTARERETLAHLQLGRSDHEIAQALYISVRTANQHVSHILRKLGVKNRREAARLATESGFSPAAPSQGTSPSGAGRAALLGQTRSAH